MQILCKNGARVKVSESLARSCFCTLIIDGVDTKGCITEMKYIGGKKFKCPACGNVEDNSECIYTIRVSIAQDEGYNVLSIISGEERINQRFDNDPKKFVIKEAIEDDFHEVLDDWLIDHQLGTFDIELYYCPTQYMTDCGMEYDLIMFVVCESEVK